MRLHIYNGLDGELENIPLDVTHVLFHESVTIIKAAAFSFGYRHLVYVIMSDNITIIEDSAFNSCPALKYIRFSKTLEVIGQFAFNSCPSIEALFLPSTVRSIGRMAFTNCEKLRLLALPANICLSNIGSLIIDGTSLSGEASYYAGVRYVQAAWNFSTVESSLQVHSWLSHRWDQVPLHKLCFDSSVTANGINDLHHEYGIASTLGAVGVHYMTPLHILVMNPYAPDDAIATLLQANPDAIHIVDGFGYTPLSYALNYNPHAFVFIYSYYRDHRIENQLSSLLASDADGRLPLHVLAMNPCTAAEDILKLYEFNTETLMYLDCDGNTPMECARECNFDGLVALIGSLCEHRRMALSVRDFSASSRRRINTTSSNVNKKRKVA